MTQYYPIKMAIVVRKDLEMSPGKMASQVGHVAARLALQAAQERPELLERYLLAEVKYVLAGRNLAHVLHLASQAASKRSLVHVFVDGGPTTEGTGGQVTAIGIFDTAGRVDSVTRDLELY